MGHDAATRNRVAGARVRPAVMHPSRNDMELRRVVGAPGSRWYRRRVASGLRLGALFVAIVLTGCAEPRGTGRAVPAELATALPVSPGINVLVISFDALRADALGAYGYTRPTSPRIDAFAADALVFERAYSTAAITPTSFAAAFSSCLEHRVFPRWQLRAPALLAQVFADAGYATAAFMNNPQLNPERGFGAGFGRYELPEGPDELTVERSVAWLREHREQRFFAWIHLLTPHTPYRRQEAAAPFYEADYTGPFIDAVPPRFVVANPRDARRVRDLYDGEVLHADRLFASLLAALQDLAIADRTVVVLTADHGEAFGERGSFQHGDVFEEQLHIPLVIRHPSVGRGQRTPLLVSNADLAPTLVAVAGLRWPVPCDGSDLRTVGGTPRAPVSLSLRRGAASLRNDDFRLVVACKEGTEGKRMLFDFGPGAHPTDDVASKHPGVVDAMTTELWRRLGLAGCPGLRAANGGEVETDGLPSKTVEALRALGYVQ